MQALATVSEIPLFWNAPHTIPATGDQTHQDQALPHTGLAAPQRDPERQSVRLLCHMRAHLLRHRGALFQSPGYSLTSWHNLVNCCMAVTEAPRPCHPQSKQEVPPMAQLQLAELTNRGNETFLSQDVPPERLGL